MSRRRSGGAGSARRRTRGPPRPQRTRGREGRRWSDRAFALPADDLEWGVPVPVDELGHRLEGEAGRQREVVADELLELGRTDPVDEIVDRPPVAAIAPVVADPPLDRVGHA